MRLLRAGLAVAIMSCLAGRLSAQAEPRRYVEIPFQGDLEKMLRDRLFDLRAMDELRKKLPSVDPKLLAQLQGDPRIQKLLEKLSTKNGAGNIDADTVKKMFEKVQREPAEMARMKDMMEKIWPKNDSPPPMPPPMDNPDRTAPPQPNPHRDDSLTDKFNRWTQDLVKNMDASRAGDLFRQSAAWQASQEELGRFFARPPESSDPAAWSWVPTELIPKKLDWSTFDHTLERFRQWLGPKIGAIDVRLPRMDIAPAASVPQVGVPVVAAPSGLAAIQGLLWFLAAAGMAIVIWQLWSHSPRLQRLVAAARWKPGPWPTDPHLIGTRAELIAAFEHLSLLRLGRQACVWNHRTIGERLARSDNPSAECRQAATELALLYGQARYAPPQERMSEEEMAAARRHLRLLVPQKS